MKCPLCKSYNTKKKILTTETLSGMGIGLFLGGPLAIAAGAVTGAVLGSNYRCLNCNAEWIYDKEEEDFGITKVFNKTIKQLSNKEFDIIWTSCNKITFDLEDEYFSCEPLDD